MAGIVEELFSHQVHIGQRTDKWNPKIRPFLFGKYKNVHVFDLNKTAEMLERAQNFLSATRLKGGKVLWVGTKPQTSFVIKKTLEEGKQFFVDEKWAPGLLTNFNEIRKRIDCYLNLKGQFDSGEIQKYTKKEIAVFKKELEKLHTAYHGVAELRKKPDVLVVLDAVGNKLAIAEAKRAKVPVVAIVDSNADPDGIAYPIPGNDDSVKSLTFLVEKLLEAQK